MDVKDAVSKAKSYVADIFDEEGPRNIGLEEIRFDDEGDAWLITIGFSRKWDKPKTLVTALGKDIDLKRTYKVVRIDNKEGGVVSIANRKVLE